MSRAVRWGLWGVLAGLVGYILYGMGVPGSEALRAALGVWAALAVVLVFGALPLLTLWLEPIIAQGLARGRSG